MKVKIEFEANLEVKQDLGMVRQICQTLGATQETVKVVNVTTSGKATPAPDQPKTEDTEPMPMDANSSVGSDPAITIQDIRALLAKKVGGHRNTIKTKLTELGANNVTSLKTGDYGEFYNFLKDLA